MNNKYDNIVGKMAKMSGGILNSGLERIPWRREMALIQENIITALNRGTKPFKSYQPTKWTSPNTKPSDITRKPASIQN